MSSVERRERVLQSALRYCNASVVASCSVTRVKIADELRPATAHYVLPLPLSLRVFPPLTFRTEIDRLFAIRYRADRNARAKEVLYSRATRLFRDVINSRYRKADVMYIYEHICDMYAIVLKKISSFI